MAKYLATYTDTIDGIEVTGFRVMTDKEVEKFEELASSITWYFTHLIVGYEIEFSSGDDLLSRIDFREISNEEFKIINKVFEDGFGPFIDEDELGDIISEEEGDDNDEDDDFDDDLEDDDEY